MRYLTLAADYTNSAVRDDFAGSVVPEEVGLSDELGSAIRGWNDRYRSIIPMSADARSTTAARSTISELDQEGIRLALRMLEELPGSKVRYYSEGELGYLPLSSVESSEPAGVTERDYRPVVQRRVGKYRRLSRAHMAAMSEWIHSNPMPYRIVGGAALGQFSDRMYGRALLDGDRSALSVAVAANSLHLDWPHDERSADWQLLVFPAWVANVVGFDWRPFVLDVLVDLAERSTARDASPTAIRRRFSDVASLVDEHLAASPVPVGPSGRLTVPVWVNGEVELARLWDDRIDRDGYFERVAEQSATVSEAPLRVDQDKSGRLPWVENGRLGDEDLWDSVDEVGDDARMALEQAHRDRAFAVATGADDSVLADLLYASSLRIPELLSIGLRSAQLWSEGEAIDRIRSVATGLPPTARKLIIEWLDGTPQPQSSVGNLVETSALMWLTFSPKWRPEADWWSAVEGDTTG